MDQLSHVLVIGTGSIGERHVRCFLETGRARVSLCEVNPKVRRDVAARYGVTGAFADLEEAIAAAPDAAVICTPANLHVAMATRLAEAGVHLLIEKPLSTSLDGIDRLVAVVRQRRLVAAVAYVYRASPLLAEMRAAIQSGRFGRPVQLVAVAGQHFPHYRPAYREIYYTDRATGGGAIQDALTHIVNAAQWLIGPVTHLAADAAHQVLQGVDVEDTVHVIARHDSVLASYSLNQHQAPSELTIHVVCERGTARLENHRQRWQWMVAPEQPWNEMAHPPAERDTLFIQQAGAFLDTVEGKSQPLCTLQEGLQTLRVNLAILAAADTHTWQHVQA